MRNNWNKYTQLQVQNLLYLNRKSNIFLYEILIHAGVNGNCACNGDNNSWLTELTVKIIATYDLTKSVTAQFFLHTEWLVILANNQLDALFHVFIYFISLHFSSITVLIIRRSNCINTSSGMISLCKWLLGMPVRRAYQAVTYTD